MYLCLSSPLCCDLFFFCCLTSIFYCLGLCLGPCSAFFIIFRSAFFIRKKYSIYLLLFLAFRARYLVCAHISVKLCAIYLFYLVLWYQLLPLALSQIILLKDVSVFHLFYVYIFCIFFSCYYFCC